jgi:hypothetical protein
MREQRVALEDGVGGTPEGGQARDVLAGQQDAPLARVLEARDHAQRRRLSAARRAEHREELAARDVELHFAHSREAAEALRNTLEPDARRIGARLDLLAHAGRQTMAET